MIATTPIPRPCERVLVMDDNEDMLSSMKDILEIGGATVRTATCAQGAFRILASGFMPNVVVVDVRLGGGERGDEFARQLRSDPRYVKTPIVLMSGDIHELRRLDEEADATVGKPFDIDRLYEILSEMCGRRA